MNLLKWVALAAPVVFTSATAAQDLVIQSPDSAITLSGGIGVLAIESREYVFAATGSDTLGSLLIWQTRAPMLNANFDVELPQNWSIGAIVDVALRGDSHMVDYDWIDFDQDDESGTDGPFEVGTPTMDNWTDRSIHPETALDWYFNGSIQAAYTMALQNNADLALYGAFEYTDVQWTAYGGTYIYSDAENGYRGDVGTFGPEKGITYRQQFPSLVAGAQSSFDLGDWTLDIGAKAGFTFNAKAIDDHWARNAHFVEDVYVAPVVGASAGVTYALSDQLDLVLGGKVDRIFLGRSNTAITAIDTGAPLENSTNASGAELFSASFKAGLSGSF